METLWTRCGGEIQYYGGYANPRLQAWPTTLRRGEPTGTAEGQGPLALVTPRLRGSLARS
jgi:hypothetical protein